MPERHAAARRAGRWPRRLAGALLVALTLFAGAGLWLRHALTASLPVLDGEQALAGLAAAVTVERDEMGVPTLKGGSRLDLARALGFVHAQDRLFQMDLLRRRAAGELAEIVGPGALPLDRAVRVHRLRMRAQRSLAAATRDDRAQLEAYAAGVNAGRAALGALPFEYLALRAEPSAWKPEDSLLVAGAMFLDLNDENGDREAALGLMHDTLPGPLFDFLQPDGTAWDAPVDGDLAPAVKIPPPEVLDLRQATAADGRPLTIRVASAAPSSFDLFPDHELDDADVGSNSWAVAGSRTADGFALLADDMHLGINVPNIWYRAQLAWTDDGVARKVVGVTLPGTPTMIVGSNTHVAWGFTNATGDFSDLVVIERDPTDADSYRTPGGPKKLEHFQERIKVKGQPDEVVDVAETLWGPIVRKDAAGRPMAVHWIAHEPDGVNPRLSLLERAASVEEALGVASQIGAPPQNLVVADDQGHIGWTIMGKLPRRVGFDGRLPTSWADGTRHWDGWLPADAYPRILDPALGRIWTANARVVSGAALAKIGEGGGYAFGARARQIRDDLMAIDKATPRDLLNVQLDNRALFLEPWRDVLLKTLTPEAVARDPRRGELRAFVLDWGGRAATDSVGYRAVRQFRTEVARRVIPPLAVACAKADPKFDVLAHINQLEAPLFALVSERPPHLLDPQYKTWDEPLLGAIDAVLADFTKDGAKIAERTWGQRNTAAIRHPLSRAIPRLAPYLDMPRDPLPGDSNMPRVLAPSNGASERLVVSPGRERDGYFHMPGGQSGHPLSEFYRKGHAAWVEGRPLPLLPGAPLHTLALKPSGP